MSAPVNLVQLYFDCCCRVHIYFSGCLIYCHQVWCNLFSSFVLALFVGGRGLLASDALRLSTKILSYTRRSRVFYAFLEYSPNISQVHYHTINAQDEFFYFFYNMTTLLHSKQYFQTD